MSQASTGGLQGRIDGALNVLSSPRSFTITVVIYLAALFALRLILFPAASEDDAEVLLLTQSLEGIYKVGQPPLYVWLAYGLVQAFGPALSVVVALKFFLLGLVYFLSHRLAYLFTGNGKWAAVAGLSVLSIYYLSWDAVLNYSQTVMLAALSLAFIHALVRIGIKPSSGTGNYIWLGLLIGVGILVKYNFIVLVVSLLAAAMMDWDLRQKLLSSHALLAALVSLGLVLPYGVWLLTGGVSGASMATAVPKLDNAALAHLTGLLDMVVGIVSILSPLLILFILFFPRAVWASGEGEENRRRWRRLCERGFLFLFALMAVMVLVSGLTEVRNHWFIVLAPFPAYAVIRIAGAYPAGKDGNLPRRVGGFAAVLALLGLAVIAGLMVRASTQSATCAKCKMVVPYEQLAEGLNDAGFSGGTIYVYDYPTQVGGNLRRYFPDSRFVSYKFSAYSPPGRAVDSGQCLAVWLLDSGAQSPATETMLAQLQKRLGVTPASEDKMRTIDVTLPGREKPLRYGFILIDDPARQGDCR